MKKKDDDEEESLSTLRIKREIKNDRYVAETSQSDSNDGDGDNTRDDKRRVLLKDRSKSMSKSKKKRKERLMAQESVEKRKVKDEEHEDHEDMKDIAKNLIVAGETLHQLNEAFNEIIAQQKDSTNPNLDLIQKKSEERRKMLKTIKRLKSRAKKAYKTVKWTPVKPEIIKKHLEDISHIKATFIIEKIHKHVDDVSEYFGRFGTISSCEELPVDNKVKIEFFERGDAIRALSHNNPGGILFYIDEFPEYDPPQPQIISPVKTELDHDTVPPPPPPPLPETRSIRMIKSDPDRADPLSNSSPTKMRYAENFAKTLIKKPVDSPQSPGPSHTVTPSSSSSSHKLQIKQERVVIGPDDFKANERDLFGVLVDNHAGLFMSTKNVDTYFSRFGDISSCSFDEENEKILVYFVSGHSLLTCINHKHKEHIVLEIAPDCRVETRASTRKRKSRSSQSRDSDHRNHDRVSPKLRKQEEVKMSKRDIKAEKYDSQDEFERRRESRKVKTERNCSDEEYRRQERFYDRVIKHEDRRENKDDQRHKSPVDMRFPSRKNSNLPAGHDQRRPWQCSKCNFNNRGTDVSHCFHCKEIRTKNWVCSHCQSINTPDKLRCFRRGCDFIRGGNWTCSCGKLNWSRSLQCHRDGCYEYQPGTWSCDKCDSAKNYKDNPRCFVCKEERVSGVKSFERDAEKQKQLEALKNVQALKDSLASPGHDTRYSSSRVKRRQSHSDYRQEYHTDRHQQQESPRGRDHQGDRRSLDHHHPQEPSSSRRSFPSCSRDEGSVNWTKLLEEKRRSEEARVAEATEQTRVVQSRLLALVSGGGDDCVDLASDDETPPAPARPGPPANLPSSNPNMQPLGDRRGRSSLGSVKPAETSSSTAPAPVLDDQVTCTLYNYILFFEQPLFSKMKTEQ